MTDIDHVVLEGLFALDWGERTVTVTLAADAPLDDEEATVATTLAMMCVPSIAAEAIVEAARGDRSCRVFVVNLESGEVETRESV
jgi:hypothetical protein